MEIATGRRAATIHVHFLNLLCAGHWLFLPSWDPSHCPTPPCLTIQEMETQGGRTEAPKHTAEKYWTLDLNLHPIPPLETASL